MANTSTTNYGWIKPEVAADDDQWGGHLNADLDGIDSIVHSIDIRPSGGAIASATPPSSPTVGMLWFDSVGGQTYVWYNDGNTSQWVIAVNASGALQPASTTMFGGVKVDGTSIQAAVDGTISVVTVPIGDNRIINGDMRIDQRWNGAAQTAPGFIVDRWAYGASIGSKGTCGRNVNSPPAPGGFPYGLNFVSSSAYTSSAADYFQLYQPIEADMISDFMWGMASAQPVTLSFWVFASLTGTFSGCFGNYASTRNYPFTFSVPTANTWTRIVVTIPGDTAGTWVLSGNGGGAILHFDLGAGSNYRTAAANAWTSAGVIGVTGTVSVVAVNGAYFIPTGVKLEIGSVATPYPRQSLAKSLADCQRYYQAFAGVNVTGYNAASGFAYEGYTTSVSMRAAPTGAISGPSYSNASNGGIGQLQPTSFQLTTQVTATGAGGMTCNVTLSAEL